jgi:hypothetical protein
MLTNSKRAAVATLIGLLLALSVLRALAQGIGPTPGGGSSSAPCSTFGTTAGTCAQGNDSRITSAVQTTAACQSWTPTDQSTAGLTFTSVSAQYCQYGNFVYAFGTLTYPSTADTNPAKISLPVAVPNQPYAGVPCVVYGTASAAIQMKAIPNTSTAGFFSDTGVNATVNSTLTLKTVVFMLIYPAS